MPRALVTGGPGSSTSISRGRSPARERRSGTVRRDLEELIHTVGSASKPMPVPSLAIRAVLQPLDALGRSPFNAWHWKSAPKPFYFDLAKARAELDWEPRYSNAEALVRAYQHYLARPEGSSASAHRRPLEGGLARVQRG